MIGWFGIWRCIHKDKYGNIIWEDEIKNSIFQQGEYDVLDYFFRGQSDPTTFYIRLFNDTPIKTDTLADLINEPAGSGYAAQQVLKNATANGWPTLALDETDYMITSKQITFIATGGSWGPVISGVLSTTINNSGRAICWWVLSQARTLMDGESLLFTGKIKLISV